MSEFNKYLESLKSLGIEIEDNRNLNMGMWINKQPFELANITFSIDSFGISLVGTQLFDEERMIQYHNELGQVIMIVRQLNSLIIKPSVNTD